MGAPAEKRRAADELIPVCRPSLGAREEANAAAAVRSGWISSAGPYLAEFEKRFSAWVGCTHGVACCNGTAAVHLALYAAGVGPGDRVVVPAFTMMASVFPIVLLGAEPVFVDCDPETWTLDPAALAGVGPPLKAILPVHIYGHPCDMDPILAWAKKTGARVIEDAAEAHGAKYRGRPAGGLGEAAAFSFYSNKILTTGEGGMVVTNDAALARRARYFHNLCFDPDPEKRFVHEGVGLNYRMTNVQAAIGCAQVERAAELVAARRAMAGKYLDRLRGLARWIQPPAEKEWAFNTYWMFGIVLKDTVRRSVAEVRAGLLAAGVDSRRFFCPGNLQPVFRGAGHPPMPVSERLWERGLYLPSSADLTDEEADRVVAALRDALGAP